MISAQSRLLFDENLSVVGAVTEEGVETTDDEGEEACAGGTVQASTRVAVVVGGRRHSTDYHWRK